MFREEKVGCFNAKTTIVSKSKKKSCSYVSRSCILPPHHPLYRSCKTHPMKLQSRVWRGSNHDTKRTSEVFEPKTQRHAFVLLRFVVSLSWVVPSKDERLDHSIYEVCFLGMLPEMFFPFLHLRHASKWSETGGHPKKNIIQAVGVQKDFPQAGKAIINPSDTWTLWIYALVAIHIFWHSLKKPLIEVQPQATNVENGEFPRFKFFAKVTLWLL